MVSNVILYKITWEIKDNSYSGGAEQLGQQHLLPVDGKARGRQDRSGFFVVGSIKNFGSRKKLCRGIFFVPGKNLGSGKFLGPGKI